MQVTPETNSEEEIQDIRRLVMALALTNYLIGADVV